MSNVGNILLDQEILLESGTNELEVLVFRVSNCVFGINVAKVREVLPAQQLTRIPQSHASVLGTFQLRDEVISCISLHEHLRLEPLESGGSETLILAEFNKQRTAYLVDQVERIHRVGWNKVFPVPPLLSNVHSPVTAVTTIEGRLVQLLDFESIDDDIYGTVSLVDIGENADDKQKKDRRVIVADDSPTAREGVIRSLQGAGYEDIAVFDNGSDAWNEIRRRMEAGETVADVIVSDVEMPQVDGFHLTKRIKSNESLSHIPVVLYSSIVTPDNRKKGEAVGADAQIAKPEVDKIAVMADKLIQESELVGV